MPHGVNVFVLGKCEAHTLPPSGRLIFGLRSIMCIVHDIFWSTMQNEYADLEVFKEDESLHIPKAWHPLCFSELI